MLRRALLASMIVLPLAATVTASEPIAVPPAVSGPMIMMVSATNGPDGVVLHVRKTNFVPTTVEVITKSKVGTEKQLMTVLKATPGEVIDVPLTCTDVSVHDLKGNMIEPKRAAFLLRRETAVLVSFTGPVDPFFLQTTKLGTLVIHLPPQHLAPPTLGPILAPSTGDPLPGPRFGPTDPLPGPRFGPTNPLSGSRFGSGEPPLAPTTPGK